MMPGPGSHGIPLADFICGHGYHSMGQDSRQAAAYQYSMELRRSNDYDINGSASADECAFAGHRRRRISRVNIVSFCAAGDGDAMLDADDIDIIDSVSRESFSCA